MKLNAICSACKFYLFKYEIKWCVYLIFIYLFTKESLESLLCAKPFYISSLSLMGVTGMQKDNYNTK